jgi:predicted nucleotidyltransferase
MASPLSPFERLRQRERERRLTLLREQLHQALGAANCTIWLFGSLARGDWDGFSDTDLLVVADSEAAAEHWADQLRQALVGDDVLALPSDRRKPWPAPPRPIGAPSAARPCNSTRHHESGPSPGLVAPSSSWAESRPWSCSTQRMRPRRSARPKRCWLG